MAHELEMNNGEASMIYSGELPWHGLGFRIPRNVPWEIGFVKCGADFHVQRAKLQTETGSHVPGHFALQRTDTGRVLSVVSDRYSVIQNVDAFRLFGEAFGSAAVLHTAGVLRHGAEVWGLAELPPMAIVSREIHRRFLLVTTGHGSRKALKVIPTATRVVCANTLAVALGGSTDGITIRHSGDVNAKLAAAGEALNAAYAEFNAYAETAERLANKTLTNGERTELLETVFGDNSEAIDRCKFLAVHGKGQRGSDIVGSAYALLAGITDYVDHETRAARSRNVNRRFAVATLGAGARVKSKALQLLAA
jgi:phage/plasmid-like protein (TIGR03299 family)